MPSTTLVPVTLVPRKGLLIVAVFDYLDTSIGPYREVGIGFPCRLRTSGPMPLLPLLAERYFPDVGSWVQLLPVTTPIANDLGRAQWGFPKFVADIRIDRTDDHVECEVTENGERLLRVEIERPGISRSTSLPMRLYSTLDDDLLMTELAIDGAGHISKIRPRARLEIASHARTRDLDGAAVANAKPIEVRWFDEYRTMLDRPTIRYRLSA